VARTDPATEPAAWVVSLEVGRLVELGGRVAIGRDDFLGRLWARFEDAGLIGISEGEIDCIEAASLGLVASPRVVDAAAAPPGRDWVGERDVTRVECWFDSESAARTAATAIASAGECVVTTVREAEPPSTDWRAGFAPLDVPGFGTIRPAWDEGRAGERDGRTTIFIDPGIGFGTGHHETTRLCLAALAAWADAGGLMKRVLDFGSGSGILAIAAAVRGAGTVDAVEIDSAVHHAILANAVRNGVDRSLTVTTHVPDAAGYHELVIANIVAEVLEQHADSLCAAVRRDAAGKLSGCVILSGLRFDDVRRVAAVYEDRLGTTPVETRLGDWHCLQFTNPRGTKA